MRQVVQCQEGHVFDVEVEPRGHVFDSKSDAACPVCGVSTGHRLVAHVGPNVVEEETSKARVRIGSALLGDFATLKEARFVAKSEATDPRATVTVEPGVETIYRLTEQTEAGTRVSIVGAAWRSKGERETVGTESD